MTKEEFIKFTGWSNVSDKDFDLINVLYMATEINKADFCKEFVAMQDHGYLKLRRSLEDIANHMIMLEKSNANIKAKNEKHDKTVALLLEKSREYNDKDLRSQAVYLVGEGEVVRRTIMLGIPLWEEDKNYILSLIPNIQPAF